MTEIWHLLCDVDFQRCKFSKFHYMIKVFRVVSFRVFHCMIIVFRGVRFRSSLCDVGLQSCQFSCVPLCFLVFHCIPIGYKGKNKAIIS
jgi:hypothetical protein